SVPKRGEVGRELGRMVRVAVHDGDASRLAFGLEPPADATELHDRRLHVRSRHAGKLERRQRRSRVLPVVLPWYCEIDRQRLELVGTYDVRNLAQPVLEERLDLAAPRAPSRRRATRPPRAPQPWVDGRGRRKAGPRPPAAGPPPIGPTRPPRRRA